MDKIVLKAENVNVMKGHGEQDGHHAPGPIVFPSKLQDYAAEPVPSLAEWKSLWAMWDMVTLEMIPKDELLSKPINLRNACIFYLGHMPAFLDIHLARATGGKPSEPAHFWTIFERGIDPDVEDPTKCHAHSEIPEEWPSLNIILKYQQAVRAKTEALYVSKKVQANGRVGRALWLSFEHEAMHLETVLYMLIQSKKILPPPGALVPDFAALAKQSENLKIENKWFTIPESDVKIGLKDSDDDFETARYFGWDNEKPERVVHVKSFRAKARPITNGEYVTYLAETNKSKMPASWCEHLHGSNRCGRESERDGAADGRVSMADSHHSRITEGKYVRTVYGAVPLKLAMDWPVMASYEELAGCAYWMGGRIPTMEEVRSIYDYVEHRKTTKFEQFSENAIPAVNGHLVNNGVAESPPSASSLSDNSSIASSSSIYSPFIDLVEANVGFRHWHPISVAERGHELCGQADIGGVWEWTSTVLKEHEGFEPMQLYPGYTADFFDGKHNIILGGSWATHPRLAGRRTFINWYQRNYPYTWAGARIVTDL